MERYEKKLLRYIIRISGFAKEDAEDILQESFIKAYHNLNDFDKSLKFSSWIYRIVHNQAISHYRKTQARPRLVAVDLENGLVKTLASNLDLAKETEAEHFKEKVAKIISQMDIKYREVLMLRFFEDKSYREISDIIKKPLGTVGVMIKRAKKQFKKIYEK